MSPLSSAFRLTGMLAMVAAAGAAGAGEDSTHRWNGTGPAWYETPCGLKGFAEARAAGDSDRQVPCAEQGAASARTDVGAAAGQTGAADRDATAGKPKGGEQARQPASPHQGHRR